MVATINTPKPAPPSGAGEAARARAPIQVPATLIPDGCNLGTVLRASAAVNLAAVIGTLAATSESGQFSAAFLSTAAVLEPVTLLTLLAWCALRRLLPRLPSMPSALVQRALAWVMPAAIAYGVLRLLLGPIGPVGRPELAGSLIALVGGMAVQHYLELRARAFSPAMAEAKLQALQSRIRPHFLFNSLNAVLAVVQSDPARAERMLENLAELFRAVMGDVRQLVSLEHELDLCRKYVEIEQTRLGERLQVNWQITPVHPRARVPQLLLQPIIENAVRYGAERVAGTCEIDVKVRQRGFTLEISVSNPIALEPIQREGNQIGLNNIRGRLALIYDLEAQLETRVRRGRFELTMTIPVENKAA
ncbi:MAG TPA: histidine kinase [Burkholderiaceae bacterium]|nr:histidine kinase [Burkholderiaceae bacterium]